MSKKGEDAGAGKPSKEDLQAAFQQKYMQFEYLNRELEQINSQKEMVAYKIAELMTLRKSLGSLEKAEGFSQLGEGFYIPSKFTDPDSLLVDVGRKIFVKMPRADAEKHLDGKIKDLEGAISKIEKHFDALSNKIQALAVELQGGL
ncbi:MAG: prefoldin subunit alpha [Candidatus Aenigmatarchaeota archaeon]